MDQQPEVPQQREVPKHVILFSYSPKLRKHVRYDALVVGSRTLPDHDEFVLNLVHFRHDDVNSHHALNGVDWADTLERTLDVPHEDDKVNQSFFWKDADDEAWELRGQLDSARRVLREYDKIVDDLKAQLAATTEGKDKTLQAIADAGATGNAGTTSVVSIDSVPSSSLPAPDASSPVIETKQYSDGSSATGPAPLPDLSPAQQEAANAAAASDSSPAPTE